MLTEDDLPRPKAALMASPPLDRLGVEELQLYITDLRAEIGRAEAEIARKKALLDAAHGFFRTP
jgi:uncharacterized small protein (DUF1192 family)